MMLLVHRFVWTTLLLAVGEVEEVEVLFVVEPL